MRTAETGVSWAILLDNKGVGKATPMVLLHSPYQTKGASRGEVKWYKEHSCSGYCARGETVHCPKVAPWS